MIMPALAQSVEKQPKKTVIWTVKEETQPQREQTKSDEKQQKKSTTGDKIVATAERYKGVPYKAGGVSPKGFDCSGYVQYVFRQHGKQLPRTADRQYEVGKKVDKKALQAGDVVFFTTDEKGASHCGIYVGKGKFIHASSSRGVIITSLDDSYWKPRYLGARRML